jgi:anti-sigma regulatory factor (Ser/Thr protein kinase)
MLPAMAMETPLRRHHITVVGSPAASGEASAWARELAAQAGLSEERTYALDLCMVDIVSNVVDHAYRGAGGEIRLEMALGRGWAEVAIIDSGPAFDPLSVPAPALAASIEDTQIGGFGIQMVRSTASGCRYERRDGLNVFTAFFAEPR